MSTIDAGSRACCHVSDTRLVSRDAGTSCFHIDALGSRRAFAFGLVPVGSGLAEAKQIFPLVGIRMAHLSELERRRLQLADIG